MLFYPKAIHYDTFYLKSYRYERVSSNAGQEERTGFQESCYMDKTQFLAAIQDMLERYRSGNPPENPMEYKFDAALKEVSLPYGLR